jgi:hypothetical protein
MYSTKEFNDMVSLPTVVTIIQRHKEAEGFCVCDEQPWPCDVRILEGILIKEAAVS